MDESGSVAVLSSEFADFPILIPKPEKMEFTKNGIKLLGSQHIISSTQPNSNTLETKDGNLIGLATVEKSWEEGDILVIPNMNQQQQKEVVVVLLVSSNKKSDYVKQKAMFKDKSSIKKAEEKEIFIDMINYRIIQSKTRLTEEAEEQIEALLEMQKGLTEVSFENSKSENITFIKEQLEMAKKETEKYLTREEIEYLCQQEEVTFKQELEEEQHQTQIEIPPKS